MEAEPLLQGDHDEETRQSERVKEAERAAVDGAKTRLDDNKIEEIKEDQKLLNPNTPKKTVTIAEQVRTASNGSDGNKKEVHFDPKMKNALLKQQNLKEEQRRRDTEMMRKKAEKNTDTCQNVVMPSYQFDQKM